ncbi:hypothetical protein STEG23_025932, partial [Scotinomys teguina]
MTAAGFPTETAASACPATKPGPALPGDLEAWRSHGPLAQPPVLSPRTASRAACPAGAASSRLAGLSMLHALVPTFALYVYFEDLEMRATCNISTEIGTSPSFSASR